MEGTTKWCVFFWEENVMTDRKTRIAVLVLCLHNFYVFVYYIESRIQDRNQVKVSLSLRFNFWMLLHNFFKGNNVIHMEPHFSFIFVNQIASVQIDIKSFLIKI